MLALLWECYFYVLQRQCYITFSSSSLITSTWFTFSFLVHFFLSFFFFVYFPSKVSQWYDLVVFTASMEIYGAAVADKLDNGRNILRRRFYRQHCTPDFGRYVINGISHFINENRRCFAYVNIFIFLSSFSLSSDATQPNLKSKPNSYTKDLTAICNDLNRVSLFSRFSFDNIWLCK